MNRFKLIFILIFLFCSQSTTPEKKLRGLRIDTAYFYDLFPSLSVSEIIKKLITEVKLFGVDTLFVYAYNPVFGALYPTDYPFTHVEMGYGKLNILKDLTLAAKSNGLKVVGVVPVNNFKSLWDQKPLWRSKTKSGSDYVPKADVFLLSAWHPDFKVWLRGFYKDLLDKNPALDGIEAVEPFVDYDWSGDSDFNIFAIENFRRIYPRSRLGDDNWIQLRSRGLTDLIALMNTEVHLHQKAAYLVQTWPVKTNGQLLTNNEIKHHMGLDFNAVLNLKSEEKPDFIIAELMWQQWASEYGRNLFFPEWTRLAALHFINFVDSRAHVLVHLELSPFNGNKGTVVPTKQEFAESLQSIRDLNIGVEVYDYSQIVKAGAWRELFEWY